MCHNNTNRDIRTAVAATNAAITHEMIMEMIEADAYVYVGNDPIKYS